MSNTSLTTKVQQSRGWTLALGIAAAVLAAILLIAYLVQYRSSVNDSTAPTPVLVAKNLIPKGTRAPSSPRSSSSRRRRSPKDDLKVGAHLRPGVPQRPRRRRRHLPGPADHDRRPERRPHRRDPDAADGQAARGRDPGLAAPAGSSATSRAAIGSTSTSRPARPAARFSACLRRTSSSCGRPPPRDSRRSFGSTRRLAQKLALAADSGTLWFLLRPAGDAKNAAEEGRSRRRTCSAQINGTEVA